MWFARSQWKGFKPEASSKSYKTQSDRVQAESKLNPVADRISAALTDDKISDEVFRLILSETDNYNQMKEEIRGRQKQGVGLSEGKKTSRSGSRENKRCHQPIQSCYKTFTKLEKRANQLEYHLLASIITYEKQVFLYDLPIKGTQQQSIINTVEKLRKLL